MKLTKTNKRVGAGVVAGVLAVGMVSTGAVTTLYTAITGNQFSADVRGEDDPPLTGALLDLMGAPMVHTFDTTRYNDQVTGIWMLENNGPDATAFDGILEAVGADVPPTLAAQLQIEYGQIGESGTIWHDAGTLLAPTSYADALGLSNPTVQGHGVVDIPVRVTLANPAALEGEPGQTLTLDASFTVSYLDPSSAS